MKTRHKEYLICFAAMAACFLGLELYKGSFKATPSDTELMSKAVRLTNATDQGSCSGEQVKAPSGEDYILTAAHCLSLAAKDGTIQVITEDGRRLTRKVIAEDAASDLALLEGIPKMEGMKIGRATYRNQEIRTFTHGKALATYKTAGVLIEEQEIMVFLNIIGSEEDATKCAGSKFKIVEVWFFRVCAMAVKEMATTALIVPGSSGGMVVNASGELVGVVSAGGDGMGWLVSLSDIRNFIKNY